MTDLNGLVLSKLKWFESRTNPPGSVAERVIRSWRERWTRHPLDKRYPNESICETCSPDWVGVDWPCAEALSVLYEMGVSTDD